MRVLLREWRWLVGTFIAFVTLVFTAAQTMAFLADRKALSVPEPMSDHGRIEQQSIGDDWEEGPRKTAGTEALDVRVVFEWPTDLPIELIQSEARDWVELYVFAYVRLAISNTGSAPFAVRDIYSGATHTGNLRHHEVSATIIGPGEFEEFVLGLDFMLKPPRSALLMSCGAFEFQRSKRAEYLGPNGVAEVQELWEGRSPAEFVSCLREHEFITNGLVGGEIDLDWIENEQGEGDRTLDFRWDESLRELAENRCDDWSNVATPNPTLVEVAEMTATAPYLPSACDCVPMIAHPKVISANIDGPDEINLTVVSIFLNDHVIGRCS